ncbi:alpha-2-macroglobulin family protein [Stappia stellulata]|uniref:alpha-2-macroglobulin family protein n=1 Tax=Stappia stellulata TaxID=71235 RepID=UPI000401B07D|nr:alpha-2-macroglobulin family protein [Stappia stellulata]
MLKRRMHAGRESRLVRSLAVLVVAGTAFLGGSVDASATDRRIVTVDEADYFGADYRTLKEVDLDACKAACVDDLQCKAFTFNTSAGWCFLKSGVGSLQSFSGAVAGRVVVVQARDEDLTQERASELSFLPRTLLDTAASFARQLPRVYRAGEGDVSVQARAAREALSRGAAEEAQAEFARALVLAPERHDLWIGLSDSLLQQEPDDWQQRNQVREDGTSATINAYLASVDPLGQAAALERLGSSLIKRQLYKPAIKAWRAALALEDQPGLRKRYEDLVAEHGFRILDHQVDADSAAPRICVVFSDKLQRSADMEPFVRVTGAGPFSVESDEAQICIDGVRHGERYSVLVRQGVPAADGETLEKSASINAYVRDRSPSVRFLGRAYVLPAGEGATIPIVSVNTSTVEAEIYRIGERGLASALRDKRVLSQLDPRRAEELRDEYGEQVWKGEIETRDPLNEDVTTAIPVADLGLEMAPGIYAMVARAADDKTNEWGPRATQWFLVSDIGITAYSGADGVTAVVRALSDATAVSGASVRLVAVNNDVLGEVESDADGFARFAPGLSRGTGGLAPALVSVETPDGDYAFLDVTSPAFDLSDRGVSGRAAPGPVDVFAWLDRGVYRPGETVHAGAMARDRTANARPDLPLTFIYDRPDGVEHARVVVADAGDGGRAHALDLPAGAQQGSWSLRIHADPKESPLAQTSFLVEDFQPERVDFTPRTDAEAFDPQDPPSVSIEARFLYGAPASGQRLEGEVILTPTREMPGRAGYTFGLADEQIYPDRASLPDGLETDGEGRVQFVPALPDLQATTAGYRARIVTRLVEAGGRFVERNLELPVLADGPRIGVKPAFDGGVEEGGPAEFDILTVAASGERMAAEGVSWSLSKLDTRYQWYRSDSRWSYEPVTTSRRVESGTLDIDADAPARLSVPVDWGRYRLEVSGPDMATSVEFNAGWYVSSASSQTPDVLEVGLDKDAYRVGETATLRMTPRADGIALVSVMSDRLLESRAIPVTAGESAVTFEVTDDWGSGAYVTATLLQPMDLKENRMPSRALGLQWLTVDPGARRHRVTLEAPERIRPRSTLDVSVQVSGQNDGQPAYLTIAAVDVGILNLTRFEAPEPSKWYFGQRRLGVDIRDFYGQLIDRTAGERGRVRSGGDGMGLNLAAPPPQEAPVALFSGVVETDGDGRASVSFDVPDFNGTLKLMAVAWSAGGVGEATRDVTVRDPLVMTATLPRFLAPGDESRLLVEIDNVEGAAGDYEVTADITGPVATDLGANRRKLRLDAGERSSLRVPIRAGDQPGDATLVLRLSGPDGPVGEKTLSLGVRDTTPPVTRRSYVTLAPGGSLSLDAGTFAGLQPRTTRVSVADGGLARINVPGLLAALDRYPYGCTEQTASRALPLLYVNEMAIAAGLDADADVRERVQTAITRVLGNQGANGSFGLWNSYGGNDTWLDAYVTDFLLRARERNHDVPERSLETALDNLENRVAYASDFQDGGEGVAYALYVLARASRASLGDLRYYADVKLDAFGSSLAKAQIGAALALYGETTRARLAFDAAMGVMQQADSIRYRDDYGTTLRDAAGVLAYATRASLEGIDTQALARQVGDRQDAATALSTQDMAWLLLAGHELRETAAQTPFALNGNAVSGALASRFDGADLLADPVSVVNRGDAPQDVVVTVSGKPVTPEAAGSSGYTITRDYFDLDGNPVDPAAVAVNTRMAVVLTVTRERPGRGRVMVVDRLPAGLTIDNPRLVRSGDVGALDWFDSVDTAEHVEFRDDRFVVAVDETRLNGDSYTFAYLARASVPGRFALPPATVEDMYRPDMNGRTGAGRFEVLGPRQ